MIRSSDADRATVIGAGVTLYEALKAYDTLKAEGILIRVIDLYSLHPIDAAALVDAGKRTGRLITVEDHYSAGGIGDAVARAVASAGLTVTRLAVTEIPRSGSGTAVFRPVQSDSAATRSRACGERSGGIFREEV